MSGIITAPKAYQKQTKGWLIEPAEILASNRDNSDLGIALLSLELMFFEPHGYYLNGSAARKPNKPTEWASGASFRKGFGSFVSYLRTTEEISADITEREIDGFYKWARCGLMHAMTMSNEILVDALEVGGKTISKALGGQIILVDPWLLLPRLSDYIDNYVNLLESSDKNSAARVNFDYTFSELIIKPGMRFETLVDRI
jgi:hypothetical protein